MVRVILFTIGLALVTASPNFDMHKAHRLSLDSHRCCKKQIMNHPPPNGEMKECVQMPKEMPSCDVEICIAKKSGYASSDGTMDKQALTELMEKDHQNDPNLVNDIVEKCINGDVSQYGREDICDLIKIKLCIKVQIIKSCDDWKAEDDCNTVKKTAEEVVKNFN